MILSVDTFTPQSSPRPYLVMADSNITDTLHTELGAPHQPGLAATAPTEHVTISLGSGPGITRTSRYQAGKMGNDDGYWVASIAPAHVFSK